MTVVAFLSLASLGLGERDRLDAQGIEPGALRSERSIAARTTRLARIDWLDG
jgi:hypothetical protein